MVCSHQWQQTGVEKDVGVCNIHATNHLSQVSTVIQ